MKWIIQFVLGQFAKKGSKKGVTQLLKVDDPVVRSSIEKITKQLESLGVNVNKLKSTEDVAKHLNIHESLLKQRTKKSKQGILSLKKKSTSTKERSFSGWTPHVIEGGGTSPDDFLKLKEDTYRRLMLNTDDAVKAFGKRIIDNTQDVKFEKLTTEQRKGILDLIEDRIRLGNREFMNKHNDLDVGLGIDLDDFASGGRAGYENGGWTDLIEDLHPFNVTPGGISRLKRDIIDPFFKKKIKWNELDEYYKQLEMDKDMRDPENVPRRGERYAAEGGVARVGFGKGKLAKEMMIGGFSKLEVLIEILKNTIKGSKDPYVKKNFPNWIKELKKEPSLANNENVWRELTSHIGKDKAVKNQRLIVHSDDSVDFFTQSEFGPHNIEKTLEFQKKHNLSRDQANKILGMEPEDRVLEMKRLETIQDRYKTRHASGGVAGQLHLNEGGRIGYAQGTKKFGEGQYSPTKDKAWMQTMPKIDPNLRKLMEEYKKRKGLAEILGV